MKTSQNCHFAAPAGGQEAEREIFLHPFYPDKQAVADWG